ncbi:MAG: hypothetical protein ABI882_00620 [Acidobacteriota bacterium]
MRFLLIGLLLIVGLNSPWVIDPGVANGTLQITGEAIELKYAYAFQCDNAEGMLDGPELRILVSDRELPDDVIAGWNGSMRLQPMVREGRVRGILLKIDPARPTASLNGTLLFPPSSPMESLLLFTSTGNNEIRKLQIANNRVVGEAQYEMKPGEGQEMPAFKFSFSFGAPLFHDQEVTARLTGASAARSAPTQSLLAFEKAVRENNLVLARTLITEAKWHEIEAHRAQVGDATFKQFVRQMIPPSAQRVRQVRQVIIRRSRAVIILNDGSGKIAMGLAQADGKWKVD